MALLNVEVVYARPQYQTVLSVAVPSGTTALEAVRSSGMLQRHPELVADTLELGVFGSAVAHDYEVEQGDRVEIYRPLLVDPVTRRRRLAKTQTR